MKIGDIAKIANVTIRTIRYYEEEGLILPSGRTSGGLRCYNAEDLKKLRVVQMLKQMNMSIEEIKELVNARKKIKIGGKAAANINKKLESISREIDESIVLLKNMKKELEVTKKMVEDCLGCDEKIDVNKCIQCNYTDERRSVSLLYASLYN